MLVCVCSWWWQQHTDKLNTQVALHQLYQYASKYYDVVRKTHFASFIQQTLICAQMQTFDFLLLHSVIMMQSLLFWIICV